MFCSGTLGVLVALLSAKVILVVLESKKKITVVFGVAKIAPDAQDRVGGEEVLIGRHVVCANEMDVTLVVKGSKINEEEEAEPDYIVLYQLSRALNTQHWSHWNRDESSTLR